MNKEYLKKEIIKYGKLAGEKNMTPGNSGNISIRYNNNMLITISGSANQYLTEDDIVLTDLNGNSLEKNKKPSSEKLMHTEIYKQRLDINAIIHVHPIYLSTFACSNIPLNNNLMAEYVFYFGEIPIAEYALPSSQELANNTAKLFKNHDAVIMANHGFVAGAKTIQEAYLKLELAESYAQVAFNTHLLGKEKLLSKIQLEEIISLKS